MEEQGLAAQAGQGQGQGQGQDAAMQAISQIVELLMQGVTVEELLRQGVDPKLVEQAMRLLQQQQRQQTQQNPGLAESASVTDLGNI